MANRTFAIGDIHGDLQALRKVMSKLPTLDADDTVVFLGDYVDRGPQSKQVIDFIRTEYPKTTKAKIVALKGNHEDGWLRVASGGWPEFILPPTNGCLATLRSYTGALCLEGDTPTQEEMTQMSMGTFFPEDILDWMNALPNWYEDENA
ncbi:MAG: serine/threonine protein phosphatase, partial [Polyangiaceae bacterium]|nr:serine/threonine protein phosphatase [Polyangiaceae bacterium]